MIFLLESGGITMCKIIVHSVNVCVCKWSLEMCVRFEEESKHKITAGLITKSKVAITEVTLSLHPVISMIIFCLLISHLKAQVKTRQHSHVRDLI